MELTQKRAFNKRKVLDIFEGNGFFDLQNDPFFKTQVPRGKHTIQFLKKEPAVPLPQPAYPHNSNRDQENGRAQHTECVQKDIYFYRRVEFGFYNNIFLIFCIHWLVGKLESC